IADSRLDVEFAVWTNGHQAVVADRAGAVRADRHTETANLRSLPLAGPCFALIPVEDFGAAIERVFDESARDVAAFLAGRSAVERLAFGRVEAANCHLIEAELLGGFRHHRIDDRVGLHRSGRALLRA